MIKGHVLDFVGLYRSILKDVAVYLPSTRRDCERDLARIISLSRTRGEPSFTVDLPKLGKILDQALSSGRLSFSGEPLSRAINCRTVVPRLFRGLWSELFDDTGCLKQDIDPNVVFLLRTLLYVGKKRRKECPPRYLFEATEEYHDVEDRLPPCPLFWDDNGFTRDRDSLGSLSDRDAHRSSERDLFFGVIGNDSELLDTVQRVADIVTSSLGEFLPSDWRFRHGPGAVADKTVDGYKYEFRHWQPQLDRVFPYDVFGLPNYRQIGLVANADLALRKEIPSEHIAVPKTQTGPRLIAKEPTANQWAQQCVADFLHTRVRDSVIGVSVDFKNQRLSQEAALHGSLTGELVTIDLKSASDRLSCWAVQRFFRANWSLLEAMRACRTRYLHNGIDAKLPSLIKLRKFSTQGSALTFPVQSIAFYLICVGSTLHQQGKPVTSKTIAQASRQVRVFGDDIIVAKVVEPFVQRALSALFLKVNQTKTHTEGNFRESCGMDAFGGHDVTPGYVPEMYEESKPQTVRTVVDIHNNFVKKGLWNTAQFLISTVPVRFRKWIPLVAPQSGAFGLISYSGHKPTAKTRWNKDLHYEETRVLLVKNKKDCEPHRHEGVGNLLQYFTENPSYGLDDWKSGMIPTSHPVIGMGWVPVHHLAE